MISRAPVVLGRDSSAAADVGFVCADSRGPSPRLGVPSVRAYRALYREWFVHFRFPGHEKQPRVASPPRRQPDEQGGALAWETDRSADGVGDEVVTFSRPLARSGHS